MPRWLSETLLETAIAALGISLAVFLTLVFAFTWFANGGVLSAEPFRPLAQIVFGMIWAGLLLGSFRACKWMIEKVRTHDREA